MSSKPKKRRKSRIICKSRKKLNSKKKAKSKLWYRSKIWSKPKTMSNWKSSKLWELPRSRRTCMSLKRSKPKKRPKYVLKRVSFGSKDCAKELKLECAYFQGQTS